MLTASMPVGHILPGNLPGCYIPAPAVNIRKMTSIIFYEAFDHIYFFHISIFLFSKTATFLMLLTLLLLLRSFISKNA